jgi:hypothetical protein
MAEVPREVELVSLTEDLEVHEVLGMVVARAKQHFQNCLQHQKTGVTTSNPRMID